MLRLDRVIKPWKQSGALNSQINLYGFWDEHSFITKSGDLGIVLRVQGVDYESLDQAAQEYAVKRLEGALKVFGPGFHVYQYLFKTSRPTVPFQDYADPVVQAAVDQRKQFFAEKLDELFTVEIFFAALIEGTRSKTGISAALARLPRDPSGGLQELKAQFSNDKRKVLLREQIEADLLRLEQRVRSFVRQLSDLVQIDILERNDSFHFFRRLLNYDPSRIDGLPSNRHFLDYQVANSDVEAERDHLRVGGHYVRVLTVKEAISETKPLVLKRLLEVQANFFVVSEWVPMDNETARKEIMKRRRHFNVSKTPLLSSLRADAAVINPRDVLIDESKQADIENLGDCLRVLGDGQSLGDFSLTIVLYAEDKRTLDRVVPDVMRLFTSADGLLFSETYNQLNAYFATVPGNYRHNLRRHYLLNSNYADISFLFTVRPGETWNDHLDREYLAVLETDNATPYYLNLHNREVAHTLILGATGSGKTTLLNALAQSIPDHERIVTIEDTAELSIRKPNVVAAECQTDTHKAQISFDDLLRSSLRWRPDRIILGEVRGAEARTLLDSFNTGHLGSLATIHANSSTKALRRFANLVMRSHQQARMEEIEAEISEAVDFVIHIERQPGRRAVREVVKLSGYDRRLQQFVCQQVFPARTEVDA